MNLFEWNELKTPLILHVRNKFIENCEFCCVFVLFATNACNSSNVNVCKRHSKPIDNIFPFRYRQGKLNGANHFTFCDCTDIYDGTCTKL